MNWINSNVQLPKSNEEYITCGKGLDGKLIVSTLGWQDGKWFSDVFNMEIPKNKIQFWMPLPQPPME